MLSEAVDTDAYHDGAAQLAGTCNVLVWDNGDDAGAVTPGIR